jgi:hypothetical protein
LATLFDDQLPPEPPALAPTRHRYSEKFEEFWAALPVSHRVEKWECSGIWKRMKLEAIAGTIIKAIKDQQVWQKYEGDGVQYIKRAPSWLRKRRWEDERPPERRVAPVKGRPLGKFR